VPGDVRHIVGKAKWKASLRGLSHNDAVAKACQLRVEHDQIVAAARQGAPLGRSHPLGTAALALAGGIDGLLKWIDERAREAVRLGDEAASWREHAAENGPDHDIPDPDWAASKAAALDAERLQINRQIARDAPHLRALGVTPAHLRKDQLFAAADIIEANPRDPETIGLSGVLNAWKEVNKPVAPEQYDYPVRLFEELHGALPVKEITVSHVRDFRAALLRMPPASGGKFDGLTMQQVIQKAAVENLKPLKASTAAKHFRCLKAIFQFAQEDGFVSVNVAAGIKFRGPKEKYVDAKKVRRRTFSPTEMEKLFEAARLAPWRDKDENFWFLRLMTYTGARPEELAQLSRRDVVTIGGHLCLSLHDEGDNHIKNPSSVRKIPVHPELLGLGFENFVRSAFHRPYLFSTLEADGRGRRYGRIQDRLTRLINRSVSDDPRLVPYSLRHTFRNTMENTNAPEWVIEGIMGHSNPEHKTGRGYGAQQVVKMAEWIAKADPFDERRVVLEFEDDEDEAPLST
jgi:integrase